MILYLIKVFVSAVVIVLVTELSKRSSTFWGGLLASLPLTSLISFLWLYGETGDAVRIINLSWSIFWLVIPSLSLFVVLPLLLRQGFRFPFALVAALIVMIVAYLGTAACVRRFGLTI